MIVKGGFVHVAFALIKRITIVILAGHLFLQSSSVVFQHFQIISFSPPSLNCIIALL